MRAIKEVAVVATGPSRKLAMVAVATIAAVAGLAVGFASATYVGQADTRPVRNEAGVSATPIGPLVVGPAQSVSSTVEAGANERLRRTLKALRDRIGALEEELRFYQRLVTPSERPPGFRIERWAVAPTETPDEYSYNLLLMQIVDRHESIAGTLQVEVVGERGGEAQTLPLQDLAVAGEGPQTFQFLYFQDFHGRLALPSGFVPRRVAVTAQVAGSGEAPLERVFDWRVEEE